MKASFVKNMLTTCLAVGMVLFLIVFTVVGHELYGLFSKPMLSLERESVVIQLDRAASAASFARALESQGLLHSARLFLALVRIQGLTHALQAGIYQVHPGESAMQFVNRVAAGDVLIETFRIIEGTTQRQVAEHLAQSPYIQYHPSDWSALVVPHASVEGLLLADTYHYDAGSESRDLLARAHANLEQYLAYSWQNRATGLPYKSAYEMLIVASILEKEAALPRERHLISGIIVNRIRKFMPLQMDPTVIYALGSRYTGALTRDDLHVDSPYNTYRYRGLPPTPIAMVGREAIEAAAHPEITNFLYFVARGDGTHQFSETYDQQREAISHYMRKDR